MRLFLNGEHVDARASVDLMHLFSRLRNEHFADLLIEAENASSIWLFKAGDRAMVRYAPSRSGVNYLACSTDGSETAIQFKPHDGSGQAVPESLTVPLRLAYQAIIHFVRLGGMTSALKWSQAA